MMEQTVPANTISHRAVYCPTKEYTSTVIVFARSEGRTRYGIKKSFQIPSPFNTTMEAVHGPRRGNVTFQNVWNGLQPSIWAASSISNGTPFQKLQYSREPNATEPEI